MLKELCQSTFPVFQPKLIFTCTENVALKFRTKKSINFLLEELSMVNFLFYLKDKYVALLAINVHNFIKSLKKGALKMI